MPAPAPTGPCTALVAALPLVLLAACAHFAGPPDDLDYSRTRTSEAGLYRGTIVPDTDPVPQGRLHTWTLHLETADGAPCGTSPFPFMRWADWRHIGPALAIHYYADDHLAWRARDAGMEVCVCRDFGLTHMEGTAGRARVAQRAAADRAAFLAAVGAESFAREGVAA